MEPPTEKLSTGKKDTEYIEEWNMDLDYILGKFDPEKHKDFVEVEVGFGDRSGHLLRKEVVAAFYKMHAAAKKDGIKLTIKSATRNFDYQKRIWERKWTGVRILSDGTNAAIDILDGKTRALKILEYSSMPGTSRHHWGTDFDINAFDNEYFETGNGLKEYRWLQANAAKFGFCQVYSNKSNRPNGYEEEKWHYSYIPTAKHLLSFASKNLKNTDINGFEGANFATDIDVKKNYILSINQNCKYTDGFN